MAIIRRYIEAGKPLVGIRTACHAFDTRGKAPPGHAEWTTFDPTCSEAITPDHHGNNLQPAIDRRHRDKQDIRSSRRQDTVRRAGLALQDQPAGGFGRCRS